MLEELITAFLGNGGGELLGGTAQDLYTVRPYSGKFESGGKFSVHDIFKGGATKGYDLKPVMYGGQPYMEDGKAVYEQVPNKSILAGSGGVKSVPKPISYNSGATGARGVGSFSPINLNNRNANFLESILRFNKDMKGLV